jgi:hypothetical protein
MFSYGNDRQIVLGGYTIRPGKVARVVTDSLLYFTAGKTHRIRRKAFYIETQNSRGVKVWLDSEAER